MDDQKLAYLRTATKVRPADDIVFTNKGVPTGHVIKAKRESDHHDIYPEGFIDGYVIAVFNLPEEEQWLSWAGTTVKYDSTTSKAEEFEYFIDGRWMSYDDAMR